jgi:hypothetical protein
MTVISCLAFLLPALSNPFDPDEIITTLIRRYSANPPSHIVYETGQVHDGGILGQEVTTGTVHKDSRKALNEIELWRNFPSLRFQKTDILPDGRRIVRQSIVFDGQTFLLLTPNTKNGLRENSASRVQPLPLGPLHAAGYLFPGTFQANLGSLSWHSDQHAESRHNMSVPQTAQRPANKLTDHEIKRHFRKPTSNATHEAWIKRVVKRTVNRPGNLIAK